MALIELYLKSPYKLYEFALVLKSNNKAETLASLKSHFGLCLCWQMIQMSFV
jgi:hypothetical protein